MGLPDAGPCESNTGKGNAPPATHYIRTTTWLDLLSIISPDTRPTEKCPTAKLQEMESQIVNVQKFRAQVPRFPSYGRFPGRKTSKNWIFSLVSRFSTPSDVSVKKRPTAKKRGISTVSEWKKNQEKLTVGQNVMNVQVNSLRTRCTGTQKSRCPGVLGLGSERLTRVSCVDVFAGDLWGYGPGVSGKVDWERNKKFKKFKKIRNKLKISTCIRLLRTFVQLDFCRGRKMVM